MRFTASHQVGEVQLGDGVFVPAHFECSFEGDGDHDVHMTIHVDDKGRPSCDELRIIRDPRKPPLSGTELRRLPVADFVTYALRAVALIRRPGDRPGNSDILEGGEIAERAIARATKRRTLTDEFMTEVASIAERVGQEFAAEEVSDVYEVSIATAYRWLKEARKRGLLTESED